ncbi:ankyrin repeat RF_0381 isoform X1 [Octopus vulgaris]|uniref:Ankyrin repeat RF_0381 isoform X1 n=1 Tax=Octopus vulgaris TaxID=6645 RepID=A0AA36BMS8_OCTVU|nr:ankyrin repeat RF_0381 isoform X1 [Octopus vulgaris]
MEEEFAADSEDEQRSNDPILENMEWELYKAVDEGNIERFVELLDRGCDVDSFFIDEANISTKSLLHVCCEKGKKELVNILLDRNTNLSARDNWGQTPLMFCILAGRTEVAKIMLDYRPELINDSDKYGDTCLHFAALNGMLDFMDILFQYNARVNAINQYGFTPLMSVIISRDIESTDIRKSVVNLLIAMGAEINLYEPRGKRTPLQLAVLTKHVDVVEILLQAGADPNIADRSGKIPLTNCILENIPVKQATGVAPIIDPNIQSMIFLLTQAGSNLNLTMCEYSHALICASFVGSAELVQFFIEQGSIPNMVFPSGVTPILAAVSRNQINVVKHLLYWNCEFQNRGRICRKRIDYYFDPFELAIFMKNWEIAKLLLFAGYQWKAGLVEKNEDLRDPLLACEEMAKWYTDYTRTTQSLQFYCIRTIRSCIGGNISQKLKSLKLPPFINNKILLNHLLSVDS